MAKTEPLTLVEIINVAFEKRVGSITLPDAYGFCVDQISPPPADRRGQLRGGQFTDPAENAQTVDHPDPTKDTMEVPADDWVDTRVYLHLFDQRDSTIDMEDAIIVWMHAKYEDGTREDRTWLVNPDQLVTAFERVFADSTAEDWTVWDETPLLNKVFEEVDYGKDVAEHAFSNR